jgi:hypothetical protein
MDDLSVKLLLYFFGLLALICVGMVVDSAITNYFRYKAIDRALTTTEIAMKEGLLTPAEFKERAEDLLNELSKKEK